ncbi:MAG: hypothetical protein ACRC78_23340 [Planktothrix sp.]
MPLIVCNLKAHSQQEMNPLLNSKTHYPLLITHYLFYSLPITHNKS